MKLGIKFSLTIAFIIVALCILLQLISFFVFSRTIHFLNKELFSEKVEQLLLLVYEQDELFFEGVYTDISTSQMRVRDKLRIDYRNQKDAVTFPFIVDTLGKVIIHPEEPADTLLFADDSIAYMKENKEGEIEYFHQGTRKWCVFKVYQPWNWILCMTTSVKNKNEAIISFIWAAASISAAVIFLSVLVVLLITGKHINPIYEVIDKLQKIAKEGTSSIQKITIGRKTPDEIKMLAQAVNKMSEDLSKVTVSKDYVDNILKTITESLIVIDSQGTILTTNPALCRMLGYAEKELIGKSVEMIFPQEVSLKKMKWEELQHTGTIYDIETLYVTKGGRQVPVSFSASFKSNEKGEVSYVVCTASNISERKRAEEALKREKEFAEGIIKLAQVIILILDREGRIVLFNPYMEMVSGYTLEEVSGKNWFTTFLPESDREKIGAVFKDALKDSSTKGVVNPIITKTGELRYIEWYDKTLKDENGAVTGLLSIGQEVSERKKAEEQRIRLEKELQQAQKMESIGTLAAGIAHEINTPIQFVGDNTNFIKDNVNGLLLLIEQYKDLIADIEGGKETKEKKEAIEERENALDLCFLKKEIPMALNQSQEGISRVTTIVKAMKEFSHRGVETKQPENINRAIESTIIISRNEWKYVAEVKTELFPSLPSVNCFIGDIKQVILNLIINAVHSISDALVVRKEEKGLITIRTRPEKDSVSIEVSDTGMGIPQKIQDKVFDPFFTTKEVGKGSGQGLSMAYASIVEKHRGKITFQTKVGEGTTFLITLPIE